MAEKSYPEMPEYVEGVGWGVDEWQCQRCPGMWPARQRDDTATHDCDEVRHRHEDLLN